MFPDPVIEHMMKKVDRAAIRERLKMTPEERLEALQREVNARAAKEAPRVQETWPSKPAPPLKFYGEEFQPPPSTVSMIFPDPVIEAYMKDVDRTILRQNLFLSVAQRLEKFAGFMQQIYGLRGGGRFRPEELWEIHPLSHAGTGSAD